MLRKMREHGHNTAASLSRATGVSQGEIGRLLMLKAGPINQHDGEVRPVVLKICAALNSTMQDLWPASMCEYRAPKTEVEVDLSLDQVAGLLDQNQDQTLALENKDTLESLYTVLTPRQRRVVDGRSVDRTLDELAEDLGVSRERIRHIESKAYRKMKDQAERIVSGDRLARRIREMK